MRPALLRSLLVCVVLVLGLGACADNADNAENGGEEASPQKRLANASDATAGEGTAAFSMQVNTKMGDGGEDGQSGDGGEDGQSGEDGQDGQSGEDGQDSQSGGGMSMSFSGEGVMDFEEEVGRMEMDLPAMGTATQTIFHKGTVYTQIPSMAGSQEQWIRQGDDEQVGAPGMDGDPAGMVEVLDAVEGDIEELGSETIRGTDVDGFGFTVTGSKLAQNEEDVPKSMADTDVPMEVWLDTGDRVRRMVMELDMGAAMQSGTQAEGVDPMGGDMNGTMTVTMEFFDFGTKVDVEVPSDDKLIDAEEFQRQMQEGMPDGQGSGEEPAEDSEDAEASEE